MCIWILLICFSYKGLPFVSFWMLGFIKSYNKMLIIPQPRRVIVLVDQWHGLHYAAQNRCVKILSGHQHNFEKNLLECARRELRSDGIYLGSIQRPEGFCISYRAHDGRVSERDCFPSDWAYRWFLQQWQLSRFTLGSSNPKFVVD